ncbi:hypothetical protein Desor_4093 [Desulfosporosinus orientis DSM 765]|uniref:Uncharacterized protein n=1 Tax=Desulfosporosinus orientis (strain ATCC 19365 / DSM 765 / NCIMB 8382 / VKM B-1628 / Singapore I) TaxID=768706 RepID=G7WH25_DESOD|nr:hypothetical protein [Desulfosporosinus orientis]AET69533.1 hypothetical protein Desor_4093 [Desulfosporosinus orientis DSM 765]
MVTAGFIAAYTITLRLKELARRTTKNAHFTESLSPNVWITLGAWTAFGGGILVLAGDYQRVQQPRVPVE